MSCAVRQITVQMAKLPSINLGKGSPEYDDSTTSMAATVAVANALFYEAQVGEITPYWLPIQGLDASFLRQQR